MSSDDLEERLRRTRETIEAFEVPDSAADTAVPTVPEPEDAEPPPLEAAETPATDELDGHKQRNALTAAEQAIRALAIGDPSKAKTRAYKAAQLDQIGAYTELTRVFDVAVQELEMAGQVSPHSWDRLSEAVGPGPLQGLIEELR